jgi:hypothetical protein
MVRVDLPAESRFALPTTRLPSTISAVAPSSLIIDIAALSSLLVPGFWITLVPFVTRAAAQARCIELLEAGACTIPFTWEGNIVAFINCSAVKI